MTSDCFVYDVPSEKGSSLKGKNLLQLGANSFLLRVDPFSKGRQNKFDRVASPESACIHNHCTSQNELQKQS